MVRNVLSNKKRIGLKAQSLYSKIKLAAATRINIIPTSVNITATWIYYITTAKIINGFIRAECFSYDDLMACGSEKGIRDNGHFRLEGKNYKVKDGDILNIRFSI